ncbi:AfsR/SARP family transcriptional regulator [Nocardia terpenica]|nr:BTAD domain-containing putative transcriptional regulator [Nocardia terpenica]NQE93462.1 hypothetical protein [Nocardia terpenica]
MSGLLSVLGPVELTIDGETVRPMPPKQQAALVMLALARGRTVSAAELIRGIWGSHRPRSALGALRNYVWSVRKVLAAGPMTLRSGSGGYRLDGPLELDIDRVERFRAEADAARLAGRLEEAEAALRRAFHCWRGGALTGVPGPWASAERARLRRLHGTLQETAVEIAIQRGDHARALADLDALIVADPLSERLRALMMTALYRCGRRSEALEVYQQIRRLLVRDQGIEPGPTLAELHRQILTDQLSAAPVPKPAASPLDPGDLVQGLWQDLSGPGVPDSVAVIVCDERRADQFCRELATRGLLEAAGPGRYRYQDLMRIFIPGAAL